MTNIKLQGPENTGGFSHNGVGYEPDDNGVIEVPSEISAHAKDHGFAVYVEKKPKKDDEDKKVLRK